jgi:hypothetical protein
MAPPHRAGDPSPAAPVWHTLPEGVRLLLTGATVGVAWKIAIVVGTVLSAVNQGHLILAGQVAPDMWVRILVNYAVPFVVASVGFLSACRQR